MSVFGCVCTDGNEALQLPILELHLNPYVNLFACGFDFCMDLSLKNVIFCGMNVFLAMEVGVFTNFASDCDDLVRKEMTRSYEVIN